MLIDCNKLISSENDINLLTILTCLHFQNYISCSPVIKFEDNFNIQPCNSKSKAAVVDVIVESTEVHSPEHGLKKI